MATGRHVAYYRVSTQRQGQSGLGLEAQQAAVSAYGGDWQLTAEFTEVESGKRHENRPKLKEALETCKRTGATLVIAKLDRLARNVAFIANLMESGVKFVAVDNPHATKLTLHLLAAVAEHEREMIATRTRDALAAAKARGVKLGNPHGLTHAAQAAGWAAVTAKADDFAARVLPTIQAQRAVGASLRDTARTLTAAGTLTANGRATWTPAAVRKVLLRLTGTP